MAMTTTTAGGGKVQVQPRVPVAALLSLLLLLLVLAAGLGGGAEAQQTTCAGQLNGLAPCLRYSVPPLPGQAPPAPGPECCSALGAVSRDCACGTFGIINSLPAKCGLPTVRCRKTSLLTYCALIIRTLPHCIGLLLLMGQTCICRADDLLFDAVRAE
jgi:hypothetical protein